MAMTNAERQARYRERQKVRLAATPASLPAGDQVEILRALLAEWGTPEPADPADIAEAQANAEHGVRALRYLLHGWMQEQGFYDHADGEIPAKVRAILAAIVPVPTDAEVEAERKAERLAVRRARAAERERLVAEGKAPVRRMTALEERQAGVRDFMEELDRKPGACGV